MRLYDTRRHEVVPFISSRTVRMYVCGITPYDAAHLGHAFTYTVFDVLARLLEDRGHVVRYVRNITDVDDDILRRAREVGRSYQDLAREETARFTAQCDALGLRRPDAEPRATGAIGAIVHAVEGLLDRGLAYSTDDGRVYVEVAKAGERFGQLSRLDRETMLEEFGRNGGDPGAPGKRDPLDLLLWQPSAADEPAWESPLGPGRPGWHIECSAMAMEELGPVVDIHGGGSDLIYPHHEAEVVQSEGLTGQGPFARFWLHTGMVGLNGAKMAKSDGNLVFVGDLLEKHSASALKRYMLEHHYRSAWSFEVSELEEAEVELERWTAAASNDEDDAPAAARFVAALEDDLDTPRALEIVDGLAARGCGAAVRRCADLLGIDLPPS